MSNYQITCCSTVDLTKEYLKELEVDCAYFHYLLEGKEYTDDLYSSITPEAFYKQISDGAEPTTSQINAEEYVTLWKPYLEKGDDIMHLTLSSGISGTINSARIAKDIVEGEYPDRKVVVLDSLSASAGYGLLIEKVVENKKNGMSLEENEAFVLENATRLQHWFFSTDLTSFIRGGRVSKTAGFVGTVLNICPLLHVDDAGKLIPMEKHRTKKKVIQEIVKKMEAFAENGGDYAGKCFISHSACLEDAKAVAELVEEKFPKLDGIVQIFDIGTVIGSHTGPGTVALFFWAEQKNR